MQQQTKPSFGRTVWDYAVILAMACVMAVNYQLLILSNAFAPSGLNGIATMLQYLFHFSIGYFSLIVNVPLAILCALTGEEIAAAAALGVRHPLMYQARRGEILLTVHAGEALRDLHFKSPSL